MAEYSIYEDNSITASANEIMNVEAGDGIADCGATRSVFGEATWHAWLELLKALGGREDSVS